MNRPTDSILKSLYKMQIEIGRVETFVSSLCPRDNIRPQEIRRLQIEVDGPKTSRTQNQRFTFQSEKPRRGQTCKRSSEQRGTAEGKGKYNTKKQLRERNVHLEIRAHSGRRTKQEGLWKGMTSFTFSDRFTAPKIRVDMDKVVMTEVQKAQQNVMGKSPSGKGKTDYLV